LADTVGIWSPFQTQHAVAAVSRWAPGLALGFHGHNDLGMATANSLAAVEAGAASVDVTVNGLGERAGNAALEEVVMALQKCLHHPPGMDTRSLVRLSRLVAQAAGRPVPPAKPVVGTAVFRHESGIHVRSILEDRETYEPFPAHEVGALSSAIVLGKHSGTTAVRHVLASRGISVTADEAVELLAAVRARAARSSTQI
jgi:homocitrate synthase NifV